MAVSGLSLVDLLPPKSEKRLFAKTHFKRYKTFCKKNLFALSYVNLLNTDG